MKTKYKLLISILAIALGILSCNDIYDNLDLPEANSRVIVTSQMNFANTIRVGGSITFGDISSGVVSRLWTFPEGVADIEGSDNNVTSTEQNVKAFFNTPGTYDITLNQVFKGDAYDLNSPNPIGSNVSSTIVVTVLPKIKTVLKAFALNADGSVGAQLNLANGAKNQITAGRMVRFIIESVEGAPANIAWTTGGTVVNLSTDKKTLDVRYNKTGNYNFQLLANTVRPSGEEKTIFTDLITVIPSTDPINLLEVKKQNGKITLVFSREIDDASIKVSDFSIKLTDKNNATLASTIATIVRNTPDTNILTITLNGQTVYDDDKALVSYNGVNSLVSSDGVFSTTFTDIPATTAGVNILEATNYDYGYEKGGIVSNNWRKFTTFCGPCTAANSNYVYTNEQVHSGNSAFKLTVLNGGVAALVNTTDGADTGDINFPLVSGGTYEIGVWAYLPSSNTFGSSEVEMRTFINTGASNIDPNVATHYFTQASPKDQWVYGSIKVTIPAASAKLIIRLRNNIAGPISPVTVYMDDITIKKLNLRP
ncbi:hypothetical protein [Mariniflexile maritimum]|uniref:hypothetical protein n=1 Tax=Mariniflexile maritimum TaxID=2682493 RepID=UPI0012F6E305|nr:hypothetical protein [Mariniflexile maritimum]